MFAQLFEVLPIATVVSGKVFVVHGGLYRREGVQVLLLSCVCVCVCVCMYVCACVCVYIHIYIYTCIHIYMYTVHNLVLKHDNSILIVMSYYRGLYRLEGAWVHAWVHA